MRTCIVSVAFRQPYLRHSDTQRSAIELQKIGNSFFYFRDELPDKHDVIREDVVTHFQKSLYGFKPHAINQAYLASVLSGKKFDKLIWLDPSVLPTVSMQVLIDALDEHPIIVRPGEEPLTKMCNAKAKKWFGVTDEDIKDERTVAGTVYGFNFNEPKAVEVFNLWKKAEEEGIFQDQDAFMAGNWADESAFALCLYKCGVKAHWPETFTYLNQKNL